MNISVKLNQMNSKITLEKHTSKEQVIAFTEELTSSANLRVTPSKEPLFTRKLDILEVIEGRTARFDCKVSGSPAPRVIWMHFGKNLIFKCMIFGFLDYSLLQ